MSKENWRSKHERLFLGVNPANSIKANRRRVRAIEHPGRREPVDHMYERYKKIAQGEINIVTVPASDLLVIKRILDHGQISDFQSFDSYISKSAKPSETAVGENGNQVIYQHPDNSKV